MNNHLKKMKELNLHKFTEPLATKTSLSASIIETSGREKVNFYNSILIISLRRFYSPLPYDQCSILEVVLKHLKDP